MLAVWVVNVIQLKSVRPQNSPSIKLKYEGQFLYTKNCGPIKPDILSELL